MAVEKRRRKKARVQVESSSEDESSEHESIHDSPSELSEFSDDETAQTASTGTAAAAGADLETPRERLHKAAHNSSEEFKQQYLKMVTEQFGEELAGLREANDFGPSSIAQLVAGLKQGVDIFSEEQQRALNL